MIVKHNEELKKHCTFKVGGPADNFVIVDTKDELEKAMQMERPLLLGNGSNTIFSDKGYRGTVIKLGKGFSGIRVEGESIIAGAGALLVSVSNAACENSLTGLEFACGIPASVGGAAYMNAGAYEHCVSEFFDDKEGYGYRMSPYMKNGQIVTEVCFRLKKGNKDEIKAQMADLTRKRTSKQPLSYPSAGSFFKRPEGYFAGKLIQDAGLKGLTVGGAQVSELHAGFLINKGGASCDDILKLMKLVQEKVMDQFGVMLEPEVRIIGE